MLLHDVYEPVATSRKKYRPSQIALKKCVPRAALIHKGGEQWCTCDPDEQIPIRQWETEEQKQAA